MSGIELISTNSDPAAGGAWGAAVNGLQLCVWTPTNTVVAGETLVAYAFLRNTTNILLEYALDVGLKPALACDFVLRDERGRETPYRASAMGAVGSSRTKHIPASTQDRYWAVLNKLFDLSPGDYTLSATARVVAPDGRRFLPVRSGEVLLKILPIPPPDTGNAEMRGEPSPGKGKR